jgi:hypothetical protein
MSLRKVEASVCAVPPYFLGIASQYLLPQVASVSVVLRSKNAARSTIETNLIRVAFTLERASYSAMRAAEILLDQLFQRVVESPSALCMISDLFPH